VVNDLQMGEASLAGSDGKPNPAQGTFPPGYPHGFTTFKALYLTLYGISFKLRTRQHAIRRYEFDDWLLQRSGADFCQHHSQVDRPGRPGLHRRRGILREIHGRGGRHILSRLPDVLQKRRAQIEKRH